MGKYKRDNNSIQRIADNFLETLLTNLFDKHQLKLVPHPSGRHEIGIDFFYQVFERNKRKQILFFEIQNKGTDQSIKVIRQKNHPEKGKISFSLELQHVEQYYSQLLEPLIFVLCDINNNRAYWYPIQIDRSIPKRVSERKTTLLKSKTAPKKPKLQIYIPSENIICAENFERFIKDIHWSVEEQIRKHANDLTSEVDFTSIEKEIEDKHIIDQAYYVLQKFEGLNVLPTTLISKLPFLRKNKYRTHVDNFNLTTDNEEFFDLIESVRLENGKLNCYNRQIFVSDQQNKLKGIINFFKANSIHHLHWGGRKYKKRICTHDLFASKDCQCARCNFDDLKLRQSHDQIQEGLNSGNLSLFERLRNGYAAYLLGDLKSSVEIFNEVYKESYEIRNQVLYILSKYNLKQLKRLVNNRYFEEDRNSLIESIQIDELSNDELFIRRNTPYLLDVFYWLKDDKFYSNTTWQIDGLLQEARKMHFYDKHGAIYSHQKSDNLIASFVRFYSFLEYNFIIFDYFSDYERVITKVLECTFALYNIVNPQSSKFERFNSVIIKLWLFYVPLTKAKNLLDTYNIVTIKSTGRNSISEELLNYSTNLLDSVAIIKDGKRADYFSSKVKIIINNIFLICSRLEEQEKTINKVISKTLEVCLKITLHNLLPFDGLNQLLRYRKDISKKNIKAIIQLYNKFDNHTYNGFSLVIKYFTEKSNYQERLMLVLEYLDIDDLDNLTFIKEDKFNDIQYVLTSLRPSDKLIVKTKLLELLNNDFKLNIYYNASIFGSIGFEPNLFSKFIDTVPDLTQRNQGNSLFGTYDNSRLDQAINILFKYNQPITDNVKKLILRCTDEQKEYYTWLMDIDGYDYTKFISIWVLKHLTVYYIERFKASKKLKEELKKSLNKKYIEGAAQFYLEHF